jgi:hypothetical protein
LAFPSNFDLARPPLSWPVKLEIRTSARIVLSARPTCFEKRQKFGFNYNLSECKTNLNTNNGKLQLVCHLRSTF